VLLGDSIIDNGAYVAAGEPDVASQIRQRLPEWTVEMRAVDGWTVADVLAGLGDLPADAQVVLSAGGNDALGQMDRLADPTPLPFAAALTVLRDVREDFRAAYAALLEAIAGRPALILTIYNPAFTGAEAPLQAPGEGGLSAFNDVIQAEALGRRMDILDLRRLFTDPADYANPIEPSARGGEKIADAVAAWCAGRGRGV
jgi:hypothetical protein